jgi:hypothetical protein
MLVTGDGDEVLSSGVSEYKQQLRRARGHVTGQSRTLSTMTSLHSYNYSASQHLSSVRPMLRVTVQELDSDRLALRVQPSRRSLLIYCISLSLNHPVTVC